MASRRTVEQMAKLVTDSSSSMLVLDLGAGYGGSARCLVREKGIFVTCLNLSSVQNERNRQMSQEQKLRTLMEVVDGSFEELPLQMTVMSWFGHNMQCYTVVIAIKFLKRSTGCSGQGVPLFLLTPCRQRWLV